MMIGRWILWDIMAVRFSEGDFLGGTAGRARRQKGDTCRAHRQRPARAGSNRRSGRSTHATNQLKKALQQHPNNKGNQGLLVIYYQRGKSLRVGCGGRAEACEVSSIQGLGHTVVPLLWRCMYGVVWCDGVWWGSSAQRDRGGITTGTSGRGECV